MVVSNEVITRQSDTGPLLELFPPLPVPPRDATLGLFFPSLKLQGGSTIESAFLQVTAGASETTSVSAIVAADEDVNPQPINALSTRSLDQRASTAANIPWSPPNWERFELVSSPDLSGIFQELIDGGFETAGDVLLLVEHDEGSDASSRSIDIDPAVVVTYRAG